MFYVYLLFLLLLKASAKQMGCISNLTFVSSDIPLKQTNFTFNQCSCQQWLYNYSGFNYFTNNQTCQLFQTFTTAYILQMNTQTQFCFINQPPTQISFALTTTSLPDVTTATISELKWNSTGITVANGNGNSSILSPYAVFVDQQYYMYIAEKGNSRISIWPSNPNGSASSAIFQTAIGQLNGPPSLYVDSKIGGIYVADESNHRVVFFANRSTTGINVTGVLSGTSPNVNGIYLDPNGTIFITDTSNNRIYNWLTNQTVVGGQDGASASQLSLPKRFFIDSDYSFYVTDSNNSRIQKWLRGATVGQTVAGGYGLGSDSNQLSGPTAVVVDSQGDILVCDSANNRIQKWSPGATTGQTVAGNGTAGSASNELNQPKGIAIDKDDNIYVVDYGNLRIQKFNVL